MPEISVVASIDALADMDGVPGSVAILTQPGRVGTFILQAGNYTARVASDARRGIYVASGKLAPAQGCWVRDWDTINGRPEWFGARTGETDFDNRPALDACVALCPVTNLSGADYWVGGRWTIATSRRAIRGVGRNANGVDPVTRILSNSATADVLMVGTDAQPDAINSFVQYVDISNLTVVSAPHPTPPKSGRKGGPSCVRGQFILNCSFNNVSALNGTNGFYFTGAVYSQIDACSAQRLQSGTTSENDYFIGCMIDGAAAIGANTGIASLYIRKFAVTGTTHAAVNYGVYTTDGFTDLFVDSVETSGVDYGIVLNGGRATRVAYPSEDCKVFNCVLDGVSHGIVIDGGSRTTAAVISNNYICPSKSPSGIGIQIVNTPSEGKGGSISLLGNQIIGTGGNTTGISIARSSGIASSGNILTDLNNPVRVGNSSQLRFSDRISNPTQTSATAAIALTDSARVVIDCSIDGKTRAFSAGIALLGGGNSVVEARLTGIDRGALVDPAKKLVSNGVQVTEIGPFGSGSLAQGLTG